jgi:AMP-binding enzyme
MPPSSPRRAESACHGIPRSAAGAVTSGQSAPIWPDRGQTTTPTLEAAVIGVPDGEYGQRLRSFVVLRPGGVADRQRRQRLCPPTAGTIQGNRYVRFVEALPRNPLPGESNPNGWLACGSRGLPCGSSGPACGVVERAVPRRQLDTGRDRWRSAARCVPGRPSVGTLRSSNVRRHDHKTACGTHNTATSTQPFARRYS